MARISTRQTARTLVRQAQVKTARRAEVKHTFRAPHLGNVAIRPRVDVTYKNIFRANGNEPKNAASSLVDTWSPSIQRKNWNTSQIGSVRMSGLVGRTRHTKVSFTGQTDNLGRSRRGRMVRRATRVAIGTASCSRHPTAVSPCSPVDRARMNTHTSAKVRGTILESVSFLAVWPK